jgi:Fe-S-cluster containining protein
MTSGDEESFWSLSLCYSSGSISVRIPFVCYRCGKCCREVSVQLATFDIHRVADFLRLSVEDFIAQYMGEITKVEKKKIKFEHTKPWKPCPFLSSQDMCAVYEVRPHPCRSYPLYTDSGDGGIGCLGYKQIKKVERAILRGVPLCCGGEPYKRPEDFQLKRIYKKFLRAKPSDEMKEAFIRINDIPTEFTI